MRNKSSFSPLGQLFHLLRGGDILGEVKIVNARFERGFGDKTGEMEGRGRQNGELPGQNSHQFSVIGNIDCRGGNRRVTIDFGKLLRAAVSDDNLVIARIGQHQSDRSADFTRTDDHYMFHIIPLHFLDKIFISVGRDWVIHSDRKRISMYKSVQNDVLFLQNAGTAMQVTEKDRELLALLGQNARMPVATLAKRLSLSRTTVQARLERLEREGVIAGYGVRLSESYLSGLIRAHVLITIAPKALSAVTASLEAIQEVTTLHSVSGTFDLIAIVAAPSISELDQLIDEIGKIDGVERTLSSIVLSTRISR